VTTATETVSQHVDGTLRHAQSSARLADRYLAVELTLLLGFLLTLTLLFAFLLGHPHCKLSQPLGGFVAQ
jgi:hypothetical protein